MKSQTLPTKRSPVTKGVFRKLSAVTQGRRRKQRAATAANARDFDDGQGGARIGRALFVILLIHLLAVAMIFVHHRFLTDRPGEQADSSGAEVQEVASVISPKPPVESGVVRSQLSPDETPYIVRKGESYASIASAHQIAEQDLRSLNNNANMRPGLLLKIPVKRVVIKATRPQSSAQTVMVNAQPAPAPQPVAEPVRDQGLVEAVNVHNAPRARPVNAGGNGYLVKKGDTFWGIATKHKVDVKTLMEFNNISDPRKLRVGMTLRIP